MSAWSQFREVGLPRCGFYDGTQTCARLIWPWQPWVAEVEEWPIHHECFHRKLVGGRSYADWDAAQDPTGHRWNFYDSCRYCGLVTPIVPFENAA